MFSCGRGGRTFAAPTCFTVNDWLEFSPAPLSSIGPFYWSLPLFVVSSHWASLASYELILVKYSRAREGLKIERYIKLAFRRRRASLLPAAPQSCPLKGGKDRQQLRHSLRPLFSSFPYKWCSAAFRSVSGQQFRV